MSSTKVTLIRYFFFFLNVAFCPLPVGAGFACPYTSTYIHIDVFGRADPTPTWVFCGYSFIF